MQPLSLRKKRPLYTGRFRQTKRPLRRICKPSRSQVLLSRFIVTLTIPPIKHSRLSIAIVAITFNIGELVPNSMTSCSYLRETPSSVTFSVMANVASENPNSFTRMLKKAKKYEAILLNIHILCSFHQPFNVPPHLRNSHRLNACVERTT